MPKNQVDFAKKFNMIRMCSSHPGRFGQCCPSIKARQAPRSGCERTARFGGSSGSGKYPKGWRLSGSDEGERSETKLLRRGVPPACAEECPAFSRTSKLSRKGGSARRCTPLAGRFALGTRPARCRRRRRLRRLSRVRSSPPPFAGTQFPSAFLSARLLDDLRIRRHVTVRRPLEPADLLR